MATTKPIWPPSPKPAARGRSGASAIVSVATSLARSLPSAPPLPISRGTSSPTKSEAGLGAEGPLRIARAARKSRAATMTPTSWPRIVSLRALATRKRETGRSARRPTPIASRMLLSSWALRWASTLRSSSESPLLVPTPWVATTIAATMKPIAASAAREAGRDQRSSQARASSRFGRKLGLAPLVEVELGQGALDHVGGHPLGNLEVAGPHRDVVERDDAGEAIAVGPREPW